MVYVHKEDVKKIQTYINSKLKDPTSSFDINMQVNQVRNHQFYIDENFRWVTLCFIMQFIKKTWT